MQLVPAMGRARSSYSDLPLRILDRFCWSEEREPCELDERGFQRYLEALYGLCPDPQVGFFGPGSMAWWVNREVVLYLGGLRALLMQVAHPKVAEGVLRHSRFRKEPFRRAWNTYLAVQTIIFGTAEQAIEVAATVFRRHQRVRGCMPAGLPAAISGEYRATDPELVAWVHATLIESAVWTLEAFVRPLRLEERQRLYVEGQLFALFFGLTPRRLPGDWDGFQRWFWGRLEWPYWFATEASREVAEALLGGIWWARPAGPLLKLWAATTLPEPMRRAIRLRLGSGHQALYRQARRWILASLPRTPSLTRFTPHYHRAMRRLSNNNLTSVGNVKTL